MSFDQPFPRHVLGPHNRCVLAMVDTCWYHTILDGPVYFFCKEKFEQKTKPMSQPYDLFCDSFQTFNRFHI